MVATIPSDSCPLWNVVCVGANEAWISGDNETILRVDLEGAVQETVTINDDWPNAIALTREGKLIYSDRNSSTVKISRQGKIETLINTPNGWKPYGLCSTSTGDILVNLSNGVRNEILRYQGKKVTQVIGKDELGDAIFAEGEHVLGIAENINGDICVADQNANKVLVLDRTGRARFRYDGTAAQRKNSFDPMYIVTDSLGQITVTDCSNDCLHILNKNGVFLRCVDNCELDKPCGTSIDSKGRLWVGLFNKNEIKVIQFLQ